MSEPQQPAKRSRCNMRVVLEELWRLWEGWKKYLWAREV
jgi:hypothetical protein